LRPCELGRKSALPRISDNLASLLLIFSRVKVRYTDEYSVRNWADLDSYWFSFVSKIKELRASLSKLVADVLGSNLRFAVPAAVVLAWKFSVALYLVARFGGFHGFATPMMRATGIGIGNPFYLFVGWDSYHYMQIAQSGYVNLQSFAFFPGYPAIIRLFYLLTNDIYLSAAIPVFLFGIAFVPVFQAVAEKYMDRASSMKCSLIAAFFPVVFVFTSIAYSESLFIFLSLLFWLEYVNLRIGRASVILAAAILTRPFGVLLSIPLIIELIRGRRLRSLAYLLFPLFSVLAWLSYGFYLTGYWFAFRVAEVTFWTETYSYAAWIISFLGGGNLYWGFWGFEALSSFVVAVFGYLVYLTFQEDWRLGTISLATYAAVLLFTGPPQLSYLRYFSFIFPVWILASKVRSWSLLITYCVFMSLSSLMIWYAFAAGIWIG
jgi:hypothetical protein